MTFNVGDKVRVVENKDRYYSEEMKNFIGKVCTIARVRNDDYLLEEDREKWSWTDEMLEPVEVYSIYVDRAYIPKPNMKIILLSGHARAGKDSSAEMMKTKLENIGKKG